MVHFSCEGTPFLLEVDVQRTAAREKVWFDSAGSRCAAWLYRPGDATAGDPRACVVMAAGTGVTKEPGTDRFAERFVAAGFTVLAFDFRGFGDSEGEPRFVARTSAQLADWRAAVTFTRRLPGVDRVALWGFSLSGGQVLQVAAADPAVAAVIAQTPLADGRAAAMSAARFSTPGALLRLFALGLVDAIGGRLGRPPVLVPLSGPRGSTAVLTTPDGQDGPRALDPEGRYPAWSQVLAARSVLGLGSYRPGRDASRVRCPLLVVVVDDDQSALTAPAVQVADRAPSAELVRVPGGHYAPFLEAHERVVEAELAFLHKHLPTDAPI